MSLAPCLPSPGMKEASNRFWAIWREYSNSTGLSQGWEGPEVDKPTQTIVKKQTLDLCGATTSYGYMLGTMQR